MSETAHTSEPSHPRSRRPKGDGSIYQDKRSGKWRGYVDLPTLDGSRNRKYFTGRTKAEVARKVRGAKQRIDRHLPIPDTKITVNEVIDMFLADGMKSELSQKTIDSHTDALKQAKKRIGGVKVVRLLPSHVTSTCRAMMAEGLAQSYAARVRNLLCQVLAYAMAEGIVERNVADLSPSISFKARDRERINEEELLAFVDAIGDEEQGDALRVAVGLGLRPGELTGLSWDRIDLDNEIAHIGQSLKNHRNATSRRHQLTVGDVKRSPNSRRTLKLPAMAIRALKRQKVRQAEQAAAAGPHWINANNLCFTTTVGTPIDPANLRRLVRRVKERAGIEAKVVPYDIRHLHQSILHDADISPKKVADVAGNDPVTSLKFYTHRLRPVVDAGVAPIDELFGDR